jgi:hypothetical protein
MQRNNYEIHITPLVGEKEVMSAVLDVMAPVYFHLKSSELSRPDTKISMPDIEAKAKKRLK